MSLLTRSSLTQACHLLDCPDTGFPDLYLLSRSSSLLLSCLPHLKVPRTGFPSGTLPHTSFSRAPVPRVLASLALARPRYYTSWTLPFNLSLGHSGA